MENYDYSASTNNQLMRKLGILTSVSFTEKYLILRNIPIQSKEFIKARLGEGKSFERHGKRWMIFLVQCSRLQIIPWKAYMLQILHLNKTVFMK